MDMDTAQTLLNKNPRSRPHPQQVARDMGIHASLNAMPGGAVVSFGHAPTSSSLHSLNDEPCTDVGPLLEQAVLGIQRVLVVTAVSKESGGVGSGSSGGEGAGRGDSGPHRSVGTGAVPAFDGAVDAGRLLRAAECCVHPRTIPAVITPRNYVARCHSIISPCKQACTCCKRLSHCVPPLDPATDSEAVLTRGEECVVLACLNTLAKIFVKWRELVGCDGCPSLLPTVSIALRRCIACPIANLHDACAAASMSRMDASSSLYVYVRGRSSQCAS
jgi:hypothetical protein